MNGVIELRQYTLVPGRRDTFVDRFERQFVESQEVLGASVIGQFRDLADADRFVWLRGFSDMEARAAALKGFYEGPVWQANRSAANAEIIDSDNVLLLRPVRAGAGFAASDQPRPAIGAEPASSLIVLLIVYLAPGEGGAPLEAALAGPLAEAGGRPLAALVTETAINSYPRLPVREGESVFVQAARFADRVTADARLAPLLAAARALGSRRVEMLRLAPAARSALR